MNYTACDVSEYLWPQIFTKDTNSKVKTKITSRAIPALTSNLVATKTRRRGFLLPRIPKPIQNNPVSPAIFYAPTSFLRWKAKTVSCREGRDEGKLWERIVRGYDHGQGRRDALRGRSPRSDSPDYLRGYNGVGKGSGGKPKPPSHIHIEGDVAYVQLTQGKVAFIDAADVDLVRWHKWHTAKSRTSSGDKFVAKKKLGGAALMHHVILGKPTNRYTQVRHKNGNGLDNRRENLWIVNIKVAWHPTPWTPGLARPKEAV